MRSRFGCAALVGCLLAPSASVAQPATLLSVPDTLPPLASPVLQIPGAPAATLPAELADRVAELNRRVRGSFAGMLLGFPALGLSAIFAIMAGFVANPWCFDLGLDDTGSYECTPPDVNHRALRGFTTGAAVLGATGLTLVVSQGVRLRHAKRERRAVLELGTAVAPAHAYRVDFTARF